MANFDLDFFDKNPLLKIFPFFIGGLILGFYVDFDVKIILFAIVFLLLFLFVIFFFWFRKRWVRSFSVFLILFLTFLISFGYSLLRKPEKIPISDKKQFFIAKVVSNPKKKLKSYQCEILILNIQDTIVNDSIIWKQKNFRVLAYSKNPLQYGDLILFKSSVRDIKNTGNPCDFDYQKFMARKGIFYSTYIDTFDLLKRNAANKLIFLSLKIRQKLLDLYKLYGFEGDVFAVVSALTLGYKDEISYEVKQQFSQTGAMHILAVSGLHVGIIYLILNFLFGFLDKTRRFAFIKPLIIITFLWFFAFITGLSPSVNRAALMFSLFSFSKILKRPYFIYNSMVFSAMILLIINPANLFSIGFQLSYMAVFSIVSFQKGLAYLIPVKNKILGWIWDLITVSIAAQIGTLPVSFFYFHQFPTYFLLTNILVIPLATIILYLAVAFLLFSFIPFLAWILSYLLKFFIKFLLLGINFINSFPYSVLKGIYINELQMFVLYAILFALTIYLINANKKALLISLALVPLMFIKPYKKLNNIAYILNIPKSTVLVADVNKNIYVVADSAFISNKFRLENSLSCFKGRVRQIIPLESDSLIYEDENIFYKNSFLKIVNKSFFFLTKSKFLGKRTFSKPKVNYVILGNNVYLKAEEISYLVDFDTVIISSANRLSQVRRWESQLEKQSKPYYSIIDKGAKEIRLK